jgi:hypothetical protein
MSVAYSIRLLSGPSHIWDKVLEGRVGLLESQAERLDLGICFGIVGAVHFFGLFVCFLQGMKDALVVCGLGKNLGDQGSIVHS